MTLLCFRIAKSEWEPHVKIIEPIKIQVESNDEGRGEKKTPKCFACTMGVPFHQIHGLVNGLIFR
jgi:hypothetical protein